MDDPQLVVFDVDGRRFALPLEQVVEVIRMVAVTPVPEAPQWLAGVVNVRGQAIPMIDLRPRLGLPPAEPDPGMVFLVASTGRRKVGVLADGVVDVAGAYATDAEHPEPTTTAYGFVKGVSRSAAGAALVLDLDRLEVPWYAS